MSVCGRKQKFHVTAMLLIFMTGLLMENQKINIKAQSQAAEIVSGEISAGTEEKNTAESVESDENGAEVITSASITDQLVSDMSFQQVQILMDEMLGEDSFSIGTALKNMINGKTVFSKEAVQQFLRSLFFDRLEKERINFFRILLLVLAAAVFSNFAAVFENDQIGDVSLYMIYLLLFTIFMNSYQQLGVSLGKQLDWMTQFMKGLAPAYFVAVSAASGAVTASVFYQGVLLLVWLVEWILLTLILPGANLYVLLCLVNHLSKEDMLSKMAELLETLISWSLKTILGAVLGLQAVRGLVAPAMDSIRRTAIGRTAGAIPAVGNAVNAVTELILAGALLVKNCLGAVAVIVLFLVGAGPVIHYGLLSLSYRFLSAAVQPVSDKRIVGCLSTMGEGCAMLLRIMLTAEILCVLIFVVLMASVEVRACLKKAFCKMGVTIYNKGMGKKGTWDVIEYERSYLQLDQMSCHILHFTYHDHASGSNRKISALCAFFYGPASDCYADHSGAFRTGESKGIAGKLFQSLSAGRKTAPYPGYGKSPEMPSGKRSRRAAGPKYSGNFAKERNRCDEV